jgi:MFS family permease
MTTKGLEPSEIRSPAGLLATCCLAMVSIGLMTNLPALCLTAIADDLGLDSAHSGLFLSCAFWGLVVSIPLSGPAADRWGFRRLLVTSAVFHSVGLYLVSGAHGTRQACLGAGVTGLGTGLLDALLTPLACAAYPKARARTANLLHAFYPIGMLLVVLLVVLLVWSGRDWRAIYRLMITTNVPYAVLLLLIPLPPHCHEGPARMPSRLVVRHVEFLLLAGVIFLAGVTELGPSQWLPSYVEQATGSTRSTGALGLLALGTMMAAGRLGNSFLARHASPKALVRVGAAVAATGLVLSALPAPAWCTVACLAMFGLGVSGIWPSVLSLAGNRFPQAGATMYCVLQTSGNVGGLVGPLALGLIAQGTGLRVAMGLLALCPVLILLLLAIYRERPDLASHVEVAATRSESPPAQPEAPNVNRSER